MYINSLKKVLSFIWPITIRVESSRNGVLEISWYNGKKVLNSKNANYSYGSLEKALVFGLSKTNLRIEKPCLILGLGEGSIIAALRKRFDYVGAITAVEWDITIIRLAREEFGVDESMGVQIINANAEDYVQDCRLSFGLVIVDLFIDCNVPEVFYAYSFWEDILRITEKGGRVLFNAGINLPNDEQICKVKSMLENHATVRVLKRVERYNTLILAEFFD